MDIRRTTFLALFLCSGMSVAAGDEQNVPQTRLQVQKDYYTRSMADVDRQHDKSAASLLTKYRTALTALRTECQKAGDLQGLLACKTELERLEKDGTAPQSDNLSENPKLRKLQTISIETSATLEKETNQSILDLYNNYVTVLEAEKKRLTIAGQIETAKAYDAEITRVKNGTKEQAAANLAKNTGTEESVQTKTDGPTDKPSKPFHEGKAECKIHTETAPAPGLEMKRQDLFGTRLGGRILKINAIAELGTKENLETRKNSSEYSRSKTESGTLDNVLRLTLATQEKGETIQGITVLIQYFGTEAGARGKVDPKEVDVESVKLPKISNQKLILDFPAVSLRRYVYRYRSSFSSSHKSESGQEFYGLMVTILNDKREILYQAVTKQTLIDSGDSVWAAFRKASQ